MPENAHIAYLALGSNLGARMHAMRQAIERLRHYPKPSASLPIPFPLDRVRDPASDAGGKTRLPSPLTKKGGQRGVERPAESESAPACDSCIHINLDTDVASLYESDPVGGPPDQGPYLNTVVRISTTLTPHELLDTVLSIESDLGRTRQDRWGPRVIDIDILLYDDLVINDARLTLPHPRLHERRFVLDPLTELAGDLVHPVLGLSITNLALRMCNGSAVQRVTQIRPSTWPAVRSGQQPRLP